MRGFFVLMAILGGTYYFLTSQNFFLSGEGTPHYAEFRIRLHANNIELVGFGKMTSLQDCLAHNAGVWSSAFSNSAEVKAVNTDCNKSLPKRYEKLFRNEPIQATYLVFERGSEEERDGRFIIYGIPSSLVMQECGRIISGIKRRYHGKVYCVEGKVG